MAARKTHSWCTDYSISDYLMGSLHFSEAYQARIDGARIEGLQFVFMAYCLPFPVPVSA